MKCAACDTAVGPDMEFCPNCHWELVSVPSSNKKLVAYMQRKLDIHRHSLERQKDLSQQLATARSEHAGTLKDLKASQSAGVQREKDLASLRAKVEQTISLEKELEQAKEEIKRLKKRTPPI
jgi:hypothetical protein